MILRRVVEHLRKQHWTSVFIELAIVVFGVYLGLQAQDWGKRLDDREHETQLVEDFLADLAIDRSQLGVGLTADVNRISAANASLEGAGLKPLLFDWQLPTSGIVDYSFDMSKASGVPADQRDRLWSGVVMGYHPTLSTSTYDAMIGAGDIRIIRDREIVREIQLYHNLSLSVGEQNDKILRLRESALYVGATWGLAPMTPTPADEYLRLVAREPRLAATIRIIGTFAVFHHGEMKSADERAARLQARLQDYLKAVK